MLKTDEQQQHKKSRGKTIL